MERLREGMEQEQSTSTSGNNRRNRRRQGVYWILTVPEGNWPEGPPNLDSDSMRDNVSYIKGQLEEGGTTGYRHYQVLVVFKRKQSLRFVQRFFGGGCHCELSRSSAADEYVWKEDTRVEGSQFEFGIKPVRRNNPIDWDKVWDEAKANNISAIQACVRVQHYRTLRAIASDFSQPTGIERVCYVFFGPTGTGKSRRAWLEAGFQAYPKDPRSKFWDGYQNQDHVVIDEFRGGIDVSHMLRWLDRYPVRVEIKGASTCLTARRIWITSNLHPNQWYPGLDSDTYEALLRRLVLYDFNPRPFSPDADI